MKLPFGTVFSDHMLLYNWNVKSGWEGKASIVPFGPISLLPSCNVFHYGQEVFEGMKVYTTVKGKNVLFRPEMNFKRLASSCDRIRLPQLPVETGIYLLKELIKTDRRFIPTQFGASLYIRPTMIATEPCLGVKASNEALFFIITSPVGSYYPGGTFNPLKIWICDKYARAAPRGTGEAKAGGNYAASIIGSDTAKTFGCQQALWLDAATNSFVEEVGAMNIFFVFKNGEKYELTTAPLAGTILPGITRDSIIKLAPRLNPNWVIKERPIPVAELLGRIRDGSCVEAFGAGTAAVVAPVKSFLYKDETYEISSGRFDIAKAIYDEVTHIQYGMKEDPFGWVVDVDS